MAHRRTRRSLNKRRTGRRSSLPVNPRLLAVIGGGVVVVGLIIWGVVALIGGAGTGAVNDTFAEGVSVAEMDVSGMTEEEAREKIAVIAEQMAAGYSSAYTVEGKTYNLTAEQMGASVDYESVLQEAIRFGNEEDAKVRNANREEAKTNGKDFPLTVMVNRETLLATLQTNGEQYNTEPVDATVSVNKQEDEDNLQLSGTLEYTEGSPGMTVDDEALADKLVAAAQNGDTNPIAAELTETQPSITKEDLEENLTLRASYDTSFQDSAYERRYNVWKMATVVNGVTLQPGEQWSINEAAGPRDANSGYKQAPGITDGGYTEQYGGGICQVSSTLYIALLKSEYEIVSRKHHSWPVTYTPPGLDATISTGGPDLVFKNNYDYPVVLLAKCDGKDARTVKIEVYGPKMDYTVKFKSELLEKTEPEEAAETVFSESLKPGKFEWTKPRKNLLKYQIWKIKYDLDGNQIGEPEKFSVETYRAFAGQITFGPTKEAEATKTAEASGMPEAGESAAGTSEASKVPEESKKPDPTKTKAPEATPTKQAPEPTKNQGGVVDEG